MKTSAAIWSAIAVVLVAGGAWYVFNHPVSVQTSGGLNIAWNQSGTSTSAPASSSAQASLTRPYSNTPMKVLLQLPDDYTIDESYRYQELGPGKDILGANFIIPAAVADGTNLGTDSSLSIEQLPKLKECTAAPFLWQDGVAVRTIVEGSTTYSVAAATGAAAGSRYEETVYALPGTNPCIAVRYFIHYGVIENYPAGAVREFDRAALLATFDAIRHSLKVVQ
ncbi:MAG: hypothetical protein PHV99_02295 [Candidatus Pacebacteria bacterium]|nr:hypothetical protein [Candidatus Paceibacterota bacterium]